MTHPSIGCPGMLVRCAHVQSPAQLYYSLEPNVLLRYEIPGPHWKVGSTLQSSMDSMTTLIRDAVQKVLMLKDMAEIDGLKATIRKLEKTAQSLLLSKTWVSGGSGDYFVTVTES